jgi:(p)ppGpp synthase/HD superfamily hydrolase
MTHEERAQFADAVRFALEAHGGQTRKGSAVPYVSHLLGVAALVLEHGGDMGQATAAILHDVLEDCENADEETLGENFGPDVARTVRRCTDVTKREAANAELDWMDLKRGYVAQLRGADLRSRLVAACDKLDNLRSIVSDLHAGGRRMLERFQPTPAQKRWYYEALREALGEDLPPRLLVELDQRLAQLRKYVPEEP